MKPVIVPKLTAFAEVESLVDDGVRWGYARAHKHDPAPSEDAIIASIVHHVMIVLDENAVCRWPHARRSDQQD